MKTPVQAIFNKAKKVFLTFIILSAMSTALWSQTMTMAPSNWVLNAQGGASETVQAIISGPLTSGAVFTGLSITMSIGSSVVAQASDIDYCWVDNNFLVFFNKKLLFTNPLVVALAGTGAVDVVVAGTFTYSLPDGSSHSATLPTGWDYVTINKPGKKK